jgi:hypothetical protein
MGLVRIRISVGVWWFVYMRNWLANQDLGCEIYTHEQVIKWERHCYELAYLRDIASITIYSYCGLDLW